MACNNWGKWGVAKWGGGGGGGRGGGKGGGAEGGGGGGMECSETNLTEKIYSVIYGKKWGVTTGANGV